MAASDEQQCLWRIGEGYLLLYGSALSGEVYRPKAEAASLSDLDFLWVGESPDGPPREFVISLAERLASRFKVKQFSHVGLKNLRHPDIQQLPPWLTNAWVPMLHRHLASTPELATAIPDGLTSLRPLQGAALAEAVDYAWRYAAMTLADAKFQGGGVSYAAAKLHLILLRIDLQARGILPLSYARSIHLSAPNVSRLFSHGLARSLYLKRGMGEVLTPGIWRETWKAARLWSLHFLKRSQVERSEAVVHLIESLSRWAEDFVAPSSRGTYGPTASQVAEALWIRSLDLPTYEAAKRSKYGVAGEQWKLWSYGERRGLTP